MGKCCLSLHGGQLKQHLHHNMYGIIPFREYLDFERLPPALPTSLPPPTVRYLKSKPRKPLPELKYIPPHMHASTEQLEIEKAVSVFYMGQQGAAEEDDVEDSGDYENIVSDCATFHILVSCINIYHSFHKTSHLAAYIQVFRCLLQY